MGLNQKNTNGHKEITNNIENFLDSQIIQDSNYLYPNGHRTTHQMRWFKGSRKRGFESDFVA